MPSNSPKWHFRYQMARFELFVIIIIIIIIIIIMQFWLNY